MSLYRCTVFLVYGNLLSRRVPEEVYQSILSQLQRKPEGIRSTILANLYYLIVNTRRITIVD